MKRKNPQAQILTPPSNRVFELAVAQFLESKMRVDFQKHLVHSKAVKDFSVKWRGPLPIRNSVTDVDTFIVSIETYIKYCPLRDKKGFVEFCFNHKDFSTRKIAVGIDKALRVAGLVDNDSQMRELCVLLSKANK